MDYITADIAAEGVTLRMDITDIPLPDDSVDVIICNHVLEHVPDDHKAMTELRRVLRVGGWGILQVPITFISPLTFEDWTIVTAREREQAFGQGDHVRIYGADYAVRLQRAGFQVRQFQWRTESTEFGGHRNRFGLLVEERLFLVTKGTSISASTSGGRASMTMAST